MVMNPAAAKPSESLAHGNCRQHGSRRRRRRQSCQAVGDNSAARRTPWLHRRDHKAGSVLPAPSTLPRARLVLAAEVVAAGSRARAPAEAQEPLLAAAGLASAATAWSRRCLAAIQGAGSAGKAGQAAASDQQCVRVCDHLSNSRFAALKLIQGARKNEETQQRQTRLFPSALINRDRVTHVRVALANGSSVSSGVPHPLNSSSKGVLPRVRMILHQVDRSSGVAPHSTPTHPPARPPARPASRPAASWGSQKDAAQSAGWTLMCSDTNSSRTSWTAIKRRKRTIK